MDTREINYREIKNIARKIRNMKKCDYRDMSIDDKIILFQLEEKLEGSKRSYDYYESKGEKRRRLKHRRDRRK